MLDFVRSPKFPYLSVFLVGVVLRGIPELMVSSYPVGYETITYYAPPMFRFHEQSLAWVFSEYFNFGPLFYVLMWFGCVVSNVHPYVILKVTGPLLYGGLAVSFLHFLKRGLKLDDKMAFMATLLCVFQVAALRESWDRFMVLLGLILFFHTLTVLKSDNKFKWLLVAVLATLTTFTREYVAFLLFVAVLGFAILEGRNRMRSFIALCPAVILFTIMYYPREFWWSDVRIGQYVLEGYLKSMPDALLIFAICYIPLLPFVVRGWRMDRSLDPMVGWLLLGSFSIIISPWIAIPGYQRWLMLLVFPFSIYALEGFKRLKLFSKHKIKTLTLIFLVFIVVGIGYSTGSFSYVVSNSWVPGNLLQSSISWSQVDDAIACLSWSNDHVVSNSSMLVEERFYGWLLIYFERANDDVKVIAYGANTPPEPALEKALGNGFQQIYLIWYTDATLEKFKMIYSHGDISIFQYSV